MKHWHRYGHWTDTTFLLSKIEVTECNHLCQCSMSIVVCVGQCSMSTPICVGHFAHIQSEIPKVSVLHF